MSTLELKELSHPSGEVIKIAAGKTLDLKTQGSVTMPTGSVIQVVSAEEPYSTSSTTSNTFVALGGGASITPSTTASRVVVTISCDVRGSETNSFGFGIMRSINGGAYSMVQTYVRHATYPVLSDETVSMTYTDSPNTTSVVSYKVGLVVYGSNAVQLLPNPYTKTGNPNGSGGSAGLWTLMEIQG